MARKKASSKQSSLLKQELPQMPEGYYSSGPNPNLRRFVEEHATPHDPETDDYDVPPFDRPITTTKATAIYNMHTYWSKKPHDAIRQYIRHFTEPGNIVLDPMCGSGGTALATLMEGRAAIAIDLSPAATFITRNYCTPVDLDGLQRAFEQVEAKVKSDIEWLYQTQCDRCQGTATTGYSLHSQVFRCPRCLARVPLFDCIDKKVSKQGKRHGRGRSQKLCPFCLERGFEEPIVARGEAKLGPVMVLVSYLCAEGCKPKRSSRRHNDIQLEKREAFVNHDMEKLAQVEAVSVPHWFPTHSFIRGDRYHRDGLRYNNVDTVDDLYTKRNLWALSAILEAIQGLPAADVRDPLLFCFSSMCLFVSRMHQDNVGTGGNITKGTYYIPPTFKEMHVWESFARKYGAIRRGIEALNASGPATNLLVSTDSACAIPSIPANSVDYIFTDPPYAGNVQYAELNFLWEVWLGFDTGWHDQEIIVNEKRGKTDVDWTRMMRQAMNECYRVLKPGRWISLCYHDASAGTWQLTQDLMAETGFIAEHSDIALYIDTDQKSFNQLMADKVTRRDLVINFRKPCPGELTAQLTLFGDEDMATFAEKGRAILSEALENHPGSPADRLYDELVSRMVRKGEFERHNFDELLHSVAEGVDGRWYLLETADLVDEAEGAKEAAAAASLEPFMEKCLTERPEESGVHYSDLFERYLLVQDKPRRLLADFLPEYFFKIADGTWCPPASAEERLQKENLRTSGTLRRIKRFGRALLGGVPPHDRDRPENVATAADWIRQCRRAGLYELGRALYEKGGFDFGELSEESQLESQEDYQICVRRS